MFWLLSRDSQVLPWLLVVAVPLLTAACSHSAPRHQCGCSVRRGYCHITQAAKSGFKCQCDYYCNGIAHPCNHYEACPGGRYSYCACVQGGGDCGAYHEKLSTRLKCSKVNRVESSSSLRQYSYEECECDYSRTGNDWGCRIGKPAPEGFKCVCEYNQGTYCEGWSLGCDEDEYCPADDYTYCACQRGGGNCGGYRWQDRDQDCNLGSTCDCNRSSDWTEGRYSIDDVIFNDTGVERSHQKWIHIGHDLEIPNASGSEQSTELSVTKTVTSESSFEYTNGTSMTTGITFEAKFGGVGLSQENSGVESQSFTYGQTTTISDEFSHVFTCTSPPYTLVRCSVYLISYDVSVPYTMNLKHKTIPDCVCKSYGIYRGTGSYKSKLIPTSISDCYYMHSNGTCATQVANSSGPQAETTWYRGLLVALSLWVIHILVWPK